jgi:IclR family KDG regulon transcriptional repressor
MSEVKSATRVMQILDLLRDHPRGLTISEVSKLLGLPKSSTHDLLHSMNQENYLHMNGSRYSLGLKVFEIGLAAARSSELIQFARPAMKWIGEELNESVQLAILDGTEVVYLSKMQFRKEIKLDSKAGDRLPSYATGLGKAILSTIPKSEVQARFLETKFERFTPRTITSLNNLTEHLDRIRTKGYAEDHGEYSKGVFCYAMPVRDSRDQTLGAMSVSLPGEPETQVRREKILQLLGEATTTLTRKFRFAGGKAKPFASC